MRCGCSAVYCSRSHPLYTYHISNCSQENGREGRGREGNVARLPVNHMWEGDLCLVSRFWQDFLSHCLPISFSVFPLFLIPFLSLSPSSSLARLKFHVLIFCAFFCKRLLSLGDWQNVTDIYKWTLSEDRLINASHAHSAHEYGKRVIRTQYRTESGKRSREGSGSRSIVCAFY